MARYRPNATALASANRRFASDRTRDTPSGWAPWVSPRPVGVTTASRAAATAAATNAMR